MKKEKWKKKGFAFFRGNLATVVVRRVFFFKSIDDAINSKASSLFTAVPFCSAPSFSARLIRPPCQSFEFVFFHLAEEKREKDGNCWHLKSQSDSVRFSLFLMVRYLLPRQEKEEESTQVEESKERRAPGGVFSWRGYSTAARPLSASLISSSSFTLRRSFPWHSFDYDDPFPALFFFTSSSFHFGTSSASKWGNLA